MIYKKKLVVEILSYEKIKVVDNLDIFSEYDDNGIFSTYYKMAYDKLNTLSLNEKIKPLKELMEKTDKVRIETKQKANGCHNDIRFLYTFNTGKNTTERRIYIERSAYALLSMYIQSNQPSTSGAISL